MNRDDLINKRFYVLGDETGYIELIDLMGEEMDIVRAARVSTDTETTGEERDIKLLRYLWKNRHTSPFESLEFKFRVKAPIVTAIQWMRHRTWTYNQESGRYMRLKEEFYIPTEWRRQSTVNKQGSEGGYNYADNTVLILELRRTAEDGYNAYQRALDMGVSKEMARFFLPTSILYTTFQAKVNLKNLLDFVSLRYDDHAQYEIRVYAEAIYHRILKPIIPNLWEMLEKQRNGN